MDINALCPHHRAQFDGAMATLVDVFGGQRVTIIVGNSATEIGGHAARELGIVTIPGDADFAEVDRPKMTDADEAPRSAEPKPFNDYVMGATLAELEPMPSSFMEAVHAGIEAGYSFSFSMYPSNRAGEDGPPSA